jgi:hypothetical protein
VLEGKSSMIPRRTEIGNPQGTRLGDQIPVGQGKYRELAHSGPDEY